MDQMRDDMSKALSLVAAFMYQDEEVFNPLLDELLGDREVLSHLVGMTAALLTWNAAAQNRTPEEAIQAFGLRILTEDLE